MAFSGVIWKGPLLIFCDFAFEIIASAISGGPVGFGLLIAGATVEGDSVGAICDGGFVGAVIEGPDSVGDVNDAAAIDDVVIEGPVSVVVMKGVSVCTKWLFGVCVGPDAGSGAVGVVGAMGADSSCIGDGAGRVSCRSFSYILISLTEI